MLVLLALVGGWVLARAALWTSPFAAPLAEHSAGFAQVVPQRPFLAHHAAQEGLLSRRSAKATGARAWPIGPPQATGLQKTGHDAFRLLAGPSLEHVMLASARERQRAAPAASTAFGAARRMRSAQPAQDVSRWSFDVWLLLRGESGIAVQAPGQVAYGASQAGAVARFRLGRGDTAAPFAYLRGSLAINAPGRDRDAAVGFGVRPVERWPLRVLAEARLQDSATGPARIRPVATVFTELPWQTLPMGFRGEIYGQAGYAAGQAATAFFDVQAVADRPLPDIIPPSSDLRAGVGIWAGGQRDAVRLDVGPRVSVRLDVGDDAPARLALDWRVRVAGNARPASGPALTLASSF